MNNLGLVRVGTAVPDLKIANTEYNTEQIIAQQLSHVFQHIRVEDTSG